MKAQTQNTPFFLVGVQRSGTTLLRLMLNSHSQIAIPEEASFLKPLLKPKWVNKKIAGENKKRIIGYLKENEQFRLWNFDATPFFQKLESKISFSLKELIELMYVSYAESENKSIWGDKSLFFGSMQLLYEMFPGAKFVHIVRDGRDVFYSWRKMDPNKSHPSVMALDWKIKHRLIKKSLKIIPEQNLYQVRYKDLLNNPQKELRRMCEFLGFEYEDQMINFYETSNKYIGKHHSDLIFKAVDKENINKWEKLLSKEEQLIYQIVAKKPLLKYGYKLSPHKITIKHYLLFLKDFSIGLPKRLVELIKVRLAFRRALRKGEATRTIKVGDMPSESVK
ncbi:MAG: sulfotransferase [Aequorivita sp.]|nr:sulfotransferase [Aequorivita sp.]MCB0746013.1 sulfotransferase [Ignavibacteriota bacterium]